MMIKVLCSFVESEMHKMANHPESPARFSQMQSWVKSPPYEGISFVKANPATHEEILLVHSPEMLLSLKIACSIGLHEIESAPTFVTAQTCDAMREAVGAVLLLSRMVQKGDQSKRGFAIVRPPGHHANRDKPSGFCLLNNTAIAVRDALTRGLERVAIIDFDGHHGNGTQEIFQKDERVAFFSLHQEDYYPGTGNLNDQVAGRIINLPLPFNTCDEVFEPIVERIFEPWLKNFEPEMIFISAGFDGHIADPLTGLAFSTTGYHAFTERLIDLAEELCEGRILFILEGGYDPLGLKENIQAVLCALAEQEEFPDSYGKNPFDCPDIQNRLDYLVKIHELD